MADKPKDNKPATEYGEVKVIKNEPLPRDQAGKTPGSAESGAMDKAQKSGPGRITIRSIGRRTLATAPSTASADDGHGSPAR